MFRFVSGSRSRWYTFFLAVALITYAPKKLENVCDLSRPASQETQFNALRIALEGDSSHEERMRDAQKVIHKL